MSVLTKHRDNPKMFPITDSTFELVAEGLSKEFAEAFLDADEQAPKIGKTFVAKAYYELKENIQIDKY